ncbi:hypothetical protein AVEN_254122-1 [Araneus ventricosus]|uniref:Mariner Mos1 transposase n=1 Tax=Araneus ventricosus TaxID=182803 RepID=A0A4Y2BY51_ARAVE|nr:hypothetical protein AVEN_254122-1 [Araneus ventricosus]
MLCCWWNWKGIVYYELLKLNQTINLIKNSIRLGNLKQAIYQKRLESADRKGMVFHQDKARPHVSLPSAPTEINEVWLECLNPPSI